METILTPCRVPWAISPTTGCVTLTHTETDVAPECTVVFGGGRLREDGKTDDRRIELEFESCYYARVEPHPDSADVESLGYRVVPADDSPPHEYLARRVARWRATGICPDSRFYVATQSPWLASLPEWFQKGFNHYVVYGRDGHVELIARGFRWREWLWLGGHLDDAPVTGKVVAEGEGTA